MHSTPASLLHELRTTPNPAVWARFVHLYTPMLHHWARRTALPGVDADDLVQDVFVLLVQKLPSFDYDPQHSFRAWLNTVLMNQIRNRLKARGRQPHAEADDALPDSRALDPAVVLEEADYREHLVSRAVQILQADFEPHTWQAFWKHVVEGRPAAEVAAEMGITANAVFVARVRILARLRQELQGLLE